MKYAFAMGTAAVLTVGLAGTVAGHQKTGTGAVFRFQQDTVVSVGDVANRRVRLGINVSLEPQPTDSLGALVEAVTPGGPADKAGIRSGDVITKLDGRAVNVAGNKSPGVHLIGLIARLDPNETVPVELRRGKTHKTQRKVSVVTASGNAVFTLGSVLLFSSPLAALETAPLNSDLGKYFGTTKGLLVINAPDNAGLGLKGGDVILLVNGRKPSDAGHLMRLMRQDTNGQPLKLKVLRHRKRITVNVRLNTNARVTTGR